MKHNCNREVSIFKTLIAAAFVFLIIVLSGALNGAEVYWHTIDNPEQVQVIDDSSQVEVKRATQVDGKYLIEYKVLGGLWFDEDNTDKELIRVGLPPRYDVVPLGE